MINLILLHFCQSFDHLIRQSQKLLVCEFQVGVFPKRNFVSKVFVEVFVVESHFVDFDLVVRFRNG